MTTFPRISIVTPSYNQGKNLEKTILSVIEQGYPNLEQIIIAAAPGLTQSRRDAEGKAYAPE